MSHPQMKFSSRILLRGSSALVTLVLAAAVTVTSFTVPGPIVSTAQAQDVSLTLQFRSALEPHGRWSKHRRWGEVWIPAKRERDWRPYTVGRWAYTDEWGWYWASEEDFGWVTYHYGRWVLDPEFGWVWIPGNEWAPAWVQWRYSDRHAGWAPLPPQDVIYDYDDDPNYWVFVGFNNFTAPNIVRVVLPPRERVVIIRQTVIVNRTIIVDGDRDRRARFAVNPGIEPRIVAARAGRPIRVATVKPVVVAGTVGVSSAVEVRADQRDRRRDRVRAQITESKETIQPAKDARAPTALKKGEEGRFGERPPRAAKEQAQRQQQPDGARSASPDATKSGADDAAKSKASEDAAKAKTDDSARSKAPDDAAKAKTEDSAKSKASDGAARSTTDDAAKSKADDSAKSRSDDDAKGARSKAPEPKGGPKSQAGEPEKSKAPEPRQAAPKGEPKSAPEPKQAAPKSESRPAPEPKQAAPKSEPRPAPEPKQAAPKQTAPEPKQVAPRAEPRSAPVQQQGAPKAAPPPQAAPAPQPAAPKAAPPPPAAAKAAPPVKDEEKAKQ